MIGWLQSKAMMIALSIIPIGIIASLAFQWIKKAAIPAVDKLPAWLKNGVIFLIGLIIITVSSALGAPVSCEDGINCLAKLDEKTLKILIEALLTLGVAKLTHLKLKKK